MQFIEFLVVLKIFHLSYAQKYAQCSDKYPECKMWREQKLCSLDSYKEYMMMTCPITCEFCKQESSNEITSPPPPTTHIPEVITPQMEILPVNSKFNQFKEVENKTTEPPRQENTSNPVVTSMPQAMKLIQSLSQMISQTSAKKASKLGSVDFAPARISEIQKLGKKMLENTHKKHTFNIPLTLRENVDNNDEDVEEPQIETKDHTLRMIIQNKKRSKIEKAEKNMKKHKKTIAKNTVKAKQVQPKKKTVQQKSVAKHLTTTVPPPDSNSDESNNDASNSDNNQNPDDDNSKNDQNQDNSAGDQSNDSQDDSSEQNNYPSSNPSPSYPSSDSSNNDQSSDSQSNQGSNPPPPSYPSYQASSSNTDSSSTTSSTTTTTTTSTSQAPQSTAPPPPSTAIIDNTNTDCDPSEDCGVKFSLIILQQFDNALNDHNSPQYKALKGNLVHDLTVDLGSDDVISDINFEAVQIGPDHNYSSTKAHFIIHGDLSNMQSLQDKVDSGNVNGLRVRPNSLVRE